MYHDHHNSTSHARSGYEITSLLYGSSPGYSRNITVFFYCFIASFLECTNNGMIVTLDHRTIANVDLDKVTLSDPNCELSKYGSLNSTHLWMNVPFNSCMTNHSTEGDKITYENIIIIKTREYSGAAKISREFKASFPFKCSYPRSAVVSVASFTPRQKVIHIETGTVA